MKTAAGGFFLREADELQLTSRAHRYLVDTGGKRGVGCAVSTAAQHGVGRMELHRHRTQAGERCE